LWGGALRDDSKNGCVADYLDNGKRSSGTKFTSPEFWALTVTSISERNSIFQNFQKRGQLREVYQNF